jgi:hypothetical protein
MERFMERNFCRQKKGPKGGNLGSRLQKSKIIFSAERLSRFCRESITKKMERFMERNSCRQKKALNGPDGLRHPPPDIWIE